MHIAEDNYAIGDPPDSLYVDTIKLHRLAAYHQRTVLESMRFNFLRLVSPENGLPGPAVVLAAVGGEEAIGIDCSGKKANFAAHLFEHRHGYNNAVSFWGFAEFGLEDLPLGLTYWYAEVDDAPYGGGMIFEPDVFYYETFLKYARTFSNVFERDVGMPVEHFWAIARGLGQLGIDTFKADGNRLSPWGFMTGTLPVRRDDLLGGPLEAAARHALKERFPELEDSAGNLGESVERFVELASGSHAQTTSRHSGQDSWRGRTWSTESVRAPAYPYIIYGQSSHDHWVVDYFRMMPFVQGVMSELRFSGSKTTTGSRQSDAYERTAAFDRRLADMLAEVPSIEPAFLKYREDAGLPNAKFYFDGGAHDREIDVPLRFGEVLIAIQTWAREVDLRIFAGDYKAIKRRWRLVKDKLKATDHLYTDYLLDHPEGRLKMEQEGLRCVLPVVCGPYTEPAVSLRKRDWLRLPPTLSPSEIDRAMPRVLTPPELENFLRDTTENELANVCKDNGWTL